MKHKALIVALIASALALGLPTATAATYTLDSVQTLARNNYPLIRQYDLIERTAKADIVNAQRAWLPQLTLSGSATYQSDVVSLPEQFNTILSSMGETVEGIHPDQYKLALNLNQTIWDGGISAAKVADAKAGRNVEIMKVETEMLALRRRVEQIFFGTLLLDEQLKQADLITGILESNLATVAAGVANGLLIESEESRLRVELLSNEQRREQIVATRTAYRRTLSIMTGVDIAETDSLAMPQLETLPSPVYDVEHRPEMLLLDAQSHKLNAQRRAADAAIMPRIALVAQGWYGYPGLDMFADMLNYQWSLNGIVGIQLQWNIASFNTWRNNVRKLETAKAGIDIQRRKFVYNDNIQRSQAEETTGRMHRIMLHDDEIIALRQTIRQASEAKVENGTMTVAELLKDVNAEAQARLQKTLHQIEYIKNIYTLNE